MTKPLIPSSHCGHPYCYCHQQFRDTGGAVVCGAMFGPNRSAIDADVRAKRDTVGPVGPMPPAPPPDNVVPFDPNRRTA